MDIYWAVQEELEALLNDSGHLRTLALLYAGKGMSAKALSIWRILAMNYLSSSSHKDQFEETDLQDSSSKFSFGQETAAIEATKILEESSDQELVLQHLGWIADINQVLAVQILISEKRTNLLSPDEVIAAIDPKKVEILQRKLENLEAAEQYCSEIGRPDAYMQLLEMYLDPKDGREPMLKAAVRLLHNHGEMLDPLQVLQCFRRQGESTSVSGRDFKKEIFVNPGWLVTR
ncbi:UNVERIFIED_CONTAM: Vacuolar sorting protein 3 [Sesamum radiatum]|uniref:Vacuolar sorting protein 3 n=1 Tax=Sesamum radiatum TaxID=300843 RepID=A0AAW2ULN1_SESRA